MSALQSISNAMEQLSDNQRKTICAYSSKEMTPNSRILWSSGTTWRGIRVEAHHFDEVETAPFQTEDHGVVMHLSTPALVELRTDDQRDHRRRVPGDLAILPATAIRQVRSRDPHDVLVVTMSQEAVAHCALEAGDGTELDLVPRAHYRDAQLEHICWALKAEAECNYISGRLYGESLALAMSIHLLRQVSTRHSSMTKKGGIAPRLLRQVIDYIESNLDTPLRMASLAGICGLSEYRFAHNFKSATGVPPYQFVIRTRLQRATQMLQQTNLSILEIACAVGCQSVSRFNSLFKREVGTTPSVYRALCR